MSQSQPRPHSTGSRSTQDALITASTAHLVELRQNSPQDCSNLIAASVDRATVEISRTIIALNATFSQQLQQASISASNGIRSAENSASSSISVVSQNASSATSSASFSLNIANLAVTSVNSALTNANNALASAQSQIVGVNLVLASAQSASTSDVLRLSSSLSSLEASLVSVKASASTAAALAVMTQQSLNSRVTAAISLAPTQLAAIVVGTMLASIFLSFAIGFVLFRARNKERESYFDDKGAAKKSKKPLSRHSLALRTGNSVVIKFSPPTSAQDDHSPLVRERQESFTTTPPMSEQEHPSMVTVSDTKEVTNNPFKQRADEWPLTSSLSDDLVAISKEYQPQNFLLEARNISAGKGLAPEFHSGIPQSDFSSLPEKASQDDPIETPHDAVLKPDPATKPTFDFESMHGLTGDFSPEDTKPSHEVGLDNGPPLVLGTVQKPSYDLVVREVEQVTPAKEALEDPFEDPTVESFKEVVDGYSEHIIEQSFVQPIQGANNSLVDDDCSEEVTNHDAKLHPNEAGDAPLQERVEQSISQAVEDPSSETPSSPAFDTDTSDSEAPDLPETTKIDSQQGSSLNVQTIPPQQTREHMPTKEPENQDTASQPLSRLREQTVSPLRQNPTINCLEKNVEPRSPSTMDEEREISPLRRNPPFQGMASLFKEQQVGQNQTKLGEGENDGAYESRGRSMIRTSDIIEARLSGLAQIDKQYDKSLQQRDQQGENDNSWPAISTPSQRISASDKVYKALTPPWRKPVGSKQPAFTKSPSPLTSSSLSRPVFVTSAAAPPQRDVSSPLRRNPPDHSPHPRSARDASPKVGSNAKEFSQALSKFQTLVSQNPQDAVVASNEVTSRAIAGIYIPGSLREQAVRNLSKSRERGTGERLKKKTIKSGAHLPR